MRSWTAAIVATLALAGGFVSAGTAVADPPAPPPPAPPAPAPAAPATTIDHDGTYTVGTDIVPGNYSSAGPVGSGTCYWKRVSSSGAILDNAFSKKAQVVQIAPSDASFKTSGCQPWQVTDASPPAPLPPLVAAGQLGSLLNMINNGARPAGDPPLPHP